MMSKRKPQAKLQHKETGTYWEASYDPNNPMGGLFDIDKQYYFRELRATDRKWWQFWKPKWERTGKVYEGRSMDDWILLKEPQ